MAAESNWLISDHTRGGLCRPCRWRCRVEPADPTAVIGKRGAWETIGCPLRANEAKRQEHSIGERRRLVSVLLEESGTAAPVDFGRYGMRAGEIIARAARPRFAATSLEKAGGRLRPMR